MAGLVSSDITCPDGSTCPENNTCCLTSQGYACCPAPNAVCCPDQDFCCPQGYKCDPEAGTCVKQGLPWYGFPVSPQIAVEETEEKPTASVVDLSDRSPSVVYCDNYYTCPDGTTCCRTPQGRWTCCIYSMGQCCRDGIHCCPHGYHCDSTSSRCLRGALSLPATPPQPAMLIQAKQQDQPLVPLEPALDTQVQTGVIRCNGRFYCPAEYTCCKAPTGEWGCCPYKLGQCCKDGKHCCEYGYNCDPTYSTCKKGYSRVPARPRKTAWFL